MIQSRVLAMNWRKCNTLLGEQHQYLWDIREGLGGWTEREETLKTHTVLLLSSSEHRQTSEGETWVGRRICEAWVAWRLKISIEESVDKNQQERDFLGGPVIKNPPSYAGAAGSIPDRGIKIPHDAPQLLILRTSKRQPTCHETTEPTHSGAHTPQLEKRKPACHN